MQQEERSFDVNLRSYQKTIHENLTAFFLGSDSSPDLTSRAAIYSLMAGGKRIRPVLMLAVSEMLQISTEIILPFACAIEMIHTYSLIHDDLPCMDNDDTRRGMPTCHVQFSEPVALLAGDALLNRSYEILLDACSDGNIGKIRAAGFLAAMAGSQGMIGGQTMDILSAGQKIPEETLRTMHKKKTGCLLTAAIVLPVFLMNESKMQHEIESGLQRFSEHLGLGFQIKDDLLDVTSTKEILGKSIGKDAEEDKSTFVTLFSIEKAQTMLEAEMNLAHNELILLRGYGLDTVFLEEISTYLLHREK